MINIITGLITEYNPFHNGHKYHLVNAQKDTKCDGTICIMSGNFMQRGTPALIDKWNRTLIALSNGIDLVIELPLVYAVSSAEHFAFGSISLLDQLNVVDNVYFGSEHGNIDLLCQIAQILVEEPCQFVSILKENLSLGLPYHTCRSNALSSLLKISNIDQLLNSSNNILGIEYIKALKKLNSSIKPYTLKREGNCHNSTDFSSDNFMASATSIRRSLKYHDLKQIENYVPSHTYKILQNLKNSNYPFIFDEDIFKYLKYNLIMTHPDLKKLPDVSEGLDNKILRDILKSNSLNEFIMNIKSKRYTYTRISRILTQSFLNLHKFDLLKLTKMPAPYARILGFNYKGREILKEMKKKSSIPIITKLPKNNLPTHLTLDIYGTKAYSLLNSSINPMDDYLKSPVIL